MSSRFNVLLLGEALEVADGALSNGEATADDLRLALINAMRRIDALERALQRLAAEVHKQGRK